MIAVVDTNVVAYYLLGTQPFVGEARRFWHAVTETIAPSAACPMLGRDLLVGEARNLGAVAGMLDRDAANLPVSVEIKKSVLIQVFGLNNLGMPKLNIERVRILEVFDLHGSNDRSKKALCTVSPSGNSITRRYFPCISGTGPQRRMRPSF